MTTYHLAGDPPATPEAWAGLASLPAARLLELGLRRFGREEDSSGEEKPDGRMLWVFPHSWHARIPPGLKVVDIFFREEAFDPTTSSRDQRFGCLAYGVLASDPPITTTTPMAQVDAELAAQGIDVAPSMVAVREALAARVQAKCRPDDPCFGDDCPSCRGGPGGT